MIINLARTRLKQGSHCFSTAITRVVNQFWDESYDEDLCFGLGCGLGFMYRRENNMCCLSGRANDIEKYFAANMGIEYKQYYFETFQDFIEKVKEYIANGEWGLLYLDASKLHYIELGLELKDINMMSEHAALIIGIDEHLEQVYLYDYAKNHLLELTYEQLKNAMYNNMERTENSERTSYLKNTFTVFRFPEKQLPLKVAVRNSIIINCQNYQNPTNKYQGEKGLALFRKELPLWKELMGEDQFRIELAAAYAYMDKIGTGGGNFRRMYARFIKQAGTILKNEKLDEISSDYFGLSRLWKEFSLSMLKLSSEYDEDLYKVQIKNLDMIMVQENRVIRKLQKVI